MGRDMRMTSPESLNGIAAASMVRPLDNNDGSSLPAAPPGIPINYRSKSAGSTKMGSEGETEIPGKGQDGIKTKTQMCPG